MVCLILIALPVLIALASWRLSARPDPHHVFIFSMLPMLDAWPAEQAITDESHSQAVA